MVVGRSSKLAKEFDKLKATALLGKGKRRVALFVALVGAHAGPQQGFEDRWAAEVGDAGEHQIRTVSVAHLHICPKLHKGLDGCRVVLKRSLSNGR